MVEEISVNNKVVLITGGTTGIGRATAVLLAGLGAKVFVFGRHQKELQDSLRDIRKVGEGYGTTADVTKPEQIDRVFKELDHKFDTIDILVNNAGLSARSILNSSYDAWIYVLKTNLVGYMYCARLALDRMLERNQGHIINIGSMSANTRDSETDLYVATKSAVQGFSDALRKLVNMSCVKLTLIEPGTVGTNLVDETPAEQRKMEAEEIMLKAEDVAGAIQFALTRSKRCEIMAIQIRAHRQII